MSHAPTPGKEIDKARLLIPFPCFKRRSRQAPSTTPAQAKRELHLWCVFGKRAWLWEKRQGMLSKDLTFGEDVR